MKARGTREKAEGQRAPVVRWLLLTLFLVTFSLTFAGCAKRPKAKPEPQEAIPAAPTSAKMQSPTVTVSDPEGKWTFSARAKTGTAASLQEGPYSMAQADGTYKSAGQPPVYMQAKRIDVDRGAQRLTLTGAVKITSSLAVLQGERMTYDLRTGKVHSVGPTKWTFASKRVAREASPGGTRGEHR